jgi:hypothetical protein
LIRQFPVLRSLDPHNQRIGYLNSVILCATRDIDSPNSLAARFYEKMFEKIYTEDPRWSEMMAGVPDADRSRLTQEASENSNRDPVSAILRSRSSGAWLYRHDFLRHQRAVYSKLGPLPDEEDKIARPVELAKWLQLLLPTYDLSEDGVVLRHFLEIQVSKQRPNYNPFIVRSNIEVQFMYLRVLLEADCLLPVLLDEVARCENGIGLATRGKNGLLRRVVARILHEAGEPTRPDEILEMQKLVEFNDSILRSQSTEENYLRPRMELLVDLGLIDRVSVQKPAGFPWEASDVTRRAAVELEPLASFSISISEYLDTKFFRSMGGVFSHPLKFDAGMGTVLRYFSDAYAQLGREFGFTPARTIALVACIEAWKQGVCLEVGDVMSMVVAASKSQFSEYLHFSGGSRIDNEFLIKVDPKIVAALPK